MLENESRARAEAFDLIRRDRESREPKAFKIARDAAMPLVVSIHEALCGRHARYLPRGSSRYLDDLSTLESITTPFSSVLDEWLSRYLPPSPYQLPGWSPRTANGPFRVARGSR